MKSIVSIKNLSKKYKKHTVLENINLDIIQGDIYGIIGENGAGKSTLLKILTNQINSFEGEVTISIDHSIRQTHIGALIENPSFHPNFTVFENLYMFYKLKFLKTDLNEVHRIIRLLGLENKTNEKVKNLSIGLKQRYGIGLALIGSPDLVILDEPTNALDPVGIKNIRELILSINEEKNTTFIISSHNLAELENICNKYIIMHKGKIIHFEVMDSKKSNQFFVFEFEAEDINIACEYFDSKNIDFTNMNNKIHTNIGIKMKSFIFDMVSEGVIPVRIYEVSKNLESIYFEEIRSLTNE
ncbi:MAG: ABC transporter ATP-binding protein [Helcococcus sp.]|nr:ABC transporter ATP-binding protein [Helcococcus sp.]